MANQKISQLPSGNPAQTGDTIPIARGGANYVISVSSLISLVPTPPPPPAVDFFWNQPYMVWMADQGSVAVLNNINTGASPVVAGGGTSVPNTPAGKPKVFRSSSNSAANSGTLITCHFNSGGSQNNITYGAIRRVGWRIRPVSTSTTRYWLALTSDTSTSNGAINTNQPNVDIAGFRYSPSAGDSTWKILCQTSISQSNAIFDTGIAPDLNTLHLFEIQWNPTTSQMSFYYDGTFLTAFTTNLPPLTTSQVWHMCYTADNQGASVAVAQDLLLSYIQFAPNV